MWSFIFLFPSIILAQDQLFNQWFEDGVMRIDLVFSGTSRDTSYAYTGLRKEQFYSGSRTSLIDPFDYGDHRFEVKDASTGKLIFSHTFCTLYREWQTTLEADSVRRAFSHVIRFPWPKSKVKVEMYDRDNKGRFNQSWSGTFDPATIYADPGNPREFETVDLEINGPPWEKVDILFLAEGYKAG